MNSADPRLEVVANDVVIDDYHGVLVADPFRWLEEHQSPRTRAWIDEQVQMSRQYLDALPGKDIAPRVTTLMDRESIGEIYKFGDTIFCVKRQRGEEQAKLYRRFGIEGHEELLLDPGTLGRTNEISLTIIDVSPDGKFLAYGLRSGGQGARQVSILNLETSETLPDELPKSAIRGFSFLPKSDGFFYVAEEVGKSSEPKTAKRHFLGESRERDKIVFYGGRASNLRLVSTFDFKSCMAVHSTARAINGKNVTSVYLQMLCKCGNPLLTLVEDSPTPWDVRVSGDQLFVLVDRRDGIGRKLLRVPRSAPDMAQAATLLVEGAERIQGWRVFGNYIVTTTVENISSVLRIYSVTGEVLGTLDLPEAGTAAILSGDGDGFFYRFESYTRPQEVYFYDFTTRSSTLFGSPAERLAHVAVRRVEYPGEDGTPIPLTLLGRSDVLEHGKAPTLLTAYGSGGISLTPQYSFLATSFVELGGVFAIAHVRGGGERGRTWAEAGKRHNRPNVHKDFIAAAEYLIFSGTADPDRIAAAGGSSSGLLVGTAMTQRPDLFCVVICLAPILDMLRYHRFDNTQFYVPQFGSSDNPEDFPVLRNYSPYHNVQDAVCYPAILVISGDADTRCDPMHARKFVARLQAATKYLERQNPILLDWNPLRGHFPTLPLATRISAIVDRLAFLCHHLGMEIS